MDREDSLGCFFIYLNDHCELKINLIETAVFLYNTTDTYSGKDIPHICHFFTQAKFLENRIYTEIYTVNCQFFALNL